jgi:BASS family bile acid:Na+ symporter
LEAELAELIISGAMCALMFSMGLTLTPDDFQRIARTPRPIVVGTIAQLIVLPLIALALARVFDLPPLLAAGMAVLGACPGGMFSNMFVHLARAHTALSITLTATSTFVTLFTMPLWLQWGLADSSGTHAAIDMPILSSALRLGMLTILPIVLGMIMRAQRPGSVRWEPSLARFSIVAITIGVVINGMEQPDPPSAEIFLESIAPVAWYTLSVFIIGAMIPVLFGISARDGATIAVELAVKNTMLGVVLLTQVLDFAAIVPILVYITVQTPAGILILVAWRMLAKRGYVEAAPEPISADPAKSDESPALQKSP